MHKSTHIDTYPHTFNAVIPVLLSLYAVGMAAFNEGVHTSLKGFRNLIWPCWYPWTLLFVERLCMWREERLATWCGTPHSSRSLSHNASNWNWTVRSEAELYLCHVVQFQVSFFQYGTNFGQERAGRKRWWKEESMRACSNKTWELDYHSSSYCVHVVKLSYLVPSLPPLVPKLMFFLSMGGCFLRLHGRQG